MLSLTTVEEGGVCGAAAPYTPPLFYLFVGEINMKAIVYTKFGPPEVQQTIKILEAFTDCVKNMMEHASFF